MEKKLKLIIPWSNSPGVKKMLLYMKLTLVISLVAVLQTWAAVSYSQTTTLSINLKNATVQTVLQQVEDQSEFYFLYSRSVINIDRTVDVQLKDVKIGEILSTVFKGTDVSYKIDGRQIVLTKNAENSEFNSQQQKSVSGKVVDSSGSSLPGVSVVVKGTTMGVITDFDGIYTLAKVPENAVLQFSFVGMKTQEIAVGNKTIIDMTLAEETVGIEEVVAIGYGTVKKSDLTGAVSSIKTDKLLNKPAINVGQALSGKAAGVEIFENGGSPDGKIRIRIRGDNSINSSNDPLYVVDGVIGVANVNLLNPNQIESLEVLKDASATAIYGARGANGVIMITTKRGIKTDKPVISYDGYVSVGTMARKLPLMNAVEWWKNYNTTMDNGAKYDPKGFAQGKYAKVTTTSLPNLFDASGNPLYNTDWQDEAYRTAISQNHQIAVRGGNAKTLYSFQLGYMHKDALLKNTYLDGYNGRLNMDSQLRDWVKFGVNMAFNYNKGNDLYSNYGIKRLIQEAIPIIPVKYPNGAWGSNRDFPGAVQDTPARYLEQMVNETATSQVTSDFYLDFKIATDLSFKSTFAIDVTSQKNNYYSGLGLVQFSKTQGGIATIQANNQIYWQNENYLSWRKQINSNNKLNLMIGLSWQERSAELLGAQSQKFSDDFYQWHNLGAGTVTMPSSSSDYKWSINSYFARFNYSLYEKYMFTATTRYDGSSKFGKNNKYAIFPSFAFAWRASDEKFLKNIAFLNNLKVRTSLGETGNQEIGDYAFLQNLGSMNTIFNNTYYSALYRNTFGNPDLKWEKTLQWDAGIDIGVLKHRIDFSLDYYLKNTSDLLLNSPIPNTSGLSTVMRNIGSVRNQGFELSLNTRNIITKNFNWMSTVLFSTNKNKVTKLGVNNEDIFPGPDHAQGPMVILRVGQPVGSLWGLTRLGTWGQNEATEAAKYSRLPGDLKYKDLNNDGKINNNDNSIIGCSSPEWTMSFSNNFTYKNFDLSFDLRFVFGNKVVFASTHNAEDRSGVANGFRNNLNAWTQTNQNTMVAERRPMKIYYDSYPDTYWMKDGSFIRGQNVLFGYNFSESFLKMVKIESLRVYISAQNLFCITSYPGYDPEVTTREGSAFGQGIDDFSEPKSRTFTFGLNVKF